MTIGMMMTMLTTSTPAPAALLPARSMASLDCVHHMDALALCRGLGDASIDMILCDLPYGTTACSWDTVIPFAPMWAQFKRVIKPRGAIVLTASQPFTSALVMSNPGMFRYEWVWQKNFGSNFAVTDYQPMKEHESVLVFGGNSYYPQLMPRNESGLSRSKYPVKPSDKPRQTLGGYVETKIRIMPELRLPGSVIKFNCERGFHPTQKPVALFEYLIRTYTQPGDVVLDPCVGSGTTAVACRNLDRRYICGDSSAEYVAVAVKRLADTDPYQPTVLPTGDVQLSLFGTVAS